MHSCRKSGARTQLKPIRLNVFSLLPNILSLKSHYVLIKAHPALLDEHVRALASQIGAPRIITKKLQLFHSKSSGEAQNAVRARRGNRGVYMGLITLSGDSQHVCVRVQIH
jgi:hypothetical protein